jgi:hypothetical protein
MVMVVVVPVVVVVVVAVAVVVVVVVVVMKACSVVFGRKSLDNRQEKEHPRGILLDRT